MSKMLERQQGENAAESYRLGEITSQAAISPDQLGIDANLAPAAIFSVAIRDPYVDDWSSEACAEVAVEEAAADLHARERRERGFWDRHPRTAYYDDNGDLLNEGKKHGWGDPVSRGTFFTALNSPSSVAWRNLIPSASALGYLSDPKKFTVITENNGETVPIDSTTRKWLSLCTDAVGIRSRGTVMAELVKDFASTGEAAGQPVRWLSVACGTALPSMQGAMHAGITPELILADFDDTAMDKTAELANEIGFNGTIEKNHMNIFDRDAMVAFAEQLKQNGGQPHLIDAMGIFEYTGNNLGVNSAHFLRSIYDMLAPGGRLVFGQMRSDRANPDFTMGVISWPYVEMRSPREFMQVVQEAGIAPNNTTLYMPTDGTYTVGAIDKPLES